MNAARSLPPVPAAPSRASLSPWVIPGHVAVVAVFDACFWNRPAAPELALAVSFAVLGAAIALTRRIPAGGRRAAVLACLLTGAIAETVVETGVCNVLMLLALTFAFSAETFFTGRAAGFDRWLAQTRAVILVPFRAAFLGITILSRLLLRAGLAGRLAAVVVIAGPTLALLLVFGMLISRGNAVFGLWTQQGFQRFWNLLPDIGVPRAVLWLLVGIGSVAFLWPSEAPDRSWKWSQHFARWPDIVPNRLGYWASLVLLAALNLMFAVANYADVVFLWQGGRLPAGVIYSEFVHEGVELLVVTVLLSALVLASIFNQPVAIASRRSLKSLGGLWIAQNLFLLLSTARRTDLYIEAYDASVERFSLLLFLLLVAAGFGLLSIMIWRGRALEWLVGRSLLAAFATLYLAQFLNLGGWVAEYNVTRWEEDHSRELDVYYLQRLGPAAWPALARAEALGATADWVRDQIRNGCPTNIAGEEEQSPQTRLDGGHWREFSLRAWWNRDALTSGAGKDKK